MLQTKNWLDEMSDQGSDFVGHWQILVGHCPMIDCYLQPCWLNSSQIKCPRYDAPKPEVAHG